MAATYDGIQVDVLDAAGAVLAPGLWNGDVKAYVGTITLASQTKNKSIHMVDLPVGVTPWAFGLLTDTSLGSSTVSVGIEGTLAKYKATGTFTTTDIWTFYMEIAQIAAITTAVGDQAGMEELWVTETNTANLPASGTFGIIALVNRH